MRKSRFTEEQIIGIFKEHQADLSAAELCRKHGISDATFYKWRSKFGGMEVSDARRLKSLEDDKPRCQNSSALDAAATSWRQSDLKVSEKWRWSSLNEKA